MNHESKPALESHPPDCHLGASVRHMTKSSSTLIQVQVCPNKASSDVMSAQNKIIDFKPESFIPLWTGKDTLAKYTADCLFMESDDYFEAILSNLVETLPEEIGAKQWRPIIDRIGLSHSLQATEKVVSALVIDVTGNVSANDLKTRLSGINAFIHTTYRHSTSCKCWRIIIPVTTPISKKSSDMLTDWITTKHLGGLKNVQALNPWKWIDFPACPHDAVQFYTAVNIPGKTLESEFAVFKAENQLKEMKNAATSASSLDTAANGNGAIASKFKSDDVSGFDDAKIVIAKIMGGMEISSSGTSSLTISQRDSILQSVVDSATLITLPDSDKGSFAMKAETDNVVSKKMPAITTDTCDLSSKLEANTTPVGITTETVTPPSVITLSPRRIAEEYCFPIDFMIDHSDNSHDDLMESIEVLVQNLKHSSEYPNIRESYCAIALELNHRGLWAPAFRPDVKIPWKKSERLPVHDTIQRDRLVLDCHWLHSKGYRIKPEEVKWRPIFKKAESFAFDIASEFAVRELKNEYRADSILALTRMQQCQMRSLRGVALEERITHIEKYQRTAGVRIPSLMERVNLAVNRWCERDRRVVDESDKYIAHARPRAMLEGSIPTINEIAVLAGMILGAPARKESTVRAFLGKLDKFMLTSS